MLQTKIEMTSMLLLYFNTYYITIITILRCLVLYISNNFQYAISYILFFFLKNIDARKSNTKIIKKKIGKDLNEEYN